MTGTGLSSVGENVSSGSVAYLQDAVVDDVDVSEPAITNTVEHVEECIGNILSGNFSPCPGGACEKCDYRTICKWRA